MALARCLAVEYSGLGALEIKYLTATATVPSGASQLVGYGADAAGLLRYPIRGEDRFWVRRKPRQV